MALLLALDYGSTALALYVGLQEGNEIPKVMWLTFGFHEGSMMLFYMNLGMTALFFILGNIPFRPLQWIMVGGMVGMVIYWMYVIANNTYLILRVILL
jgi:hypothetical protein